MSSCGNDDLAAGYILYASQRFARPNRAGIQGLWKVRKPGKGRTRETPRCILVEGCGDERNLHKCAAEMDRWLKLGEGS